jgi:hypothetical protein
VLSSVVSELIESFLEGSNANSQQKHYKPVLDQSDEAIHYTLIGNENNCDTVI